MAFSGNIAGLWMESVANSTITFQLSCLFNSFYFNLVQVNICKNALEHILDIENALYEITVH